MCEITIDPTTETNDTVQKEVIEGVSFYSVRNVCMYEIHDTTTAMTFEPTCTTELCVYFLIDGAEHEAFGHWVYESAVFLPFFHLLKVKYPTIKLVRQGNRTYKRLFCKYFDIDEKDVVGEIDTDSSNLCIFPEAGMHLTMTEVTSQFKCIINRFWKEVEQRMPNPPSEMIEYCLMPRQTKENYICLERVVPFDKIREFLTMRTIPYRVLETDTITDLNDQIRSVQSAQTIILVDGSALLVNGLFCKGKTILVNGNNTVRLRTAYPRMMFIVEVIQKQNNGFFFVDQDGVVDYLQSLY